MRFPNFRAEIIENFRKQAGTRSFQIRSCKFDGLIVIFELFWLIAIRHCLFLDILKKVNQSFNFPIFTAMRKAYPQAFCRNCLLIHRFQNIRTARPLQSFRCASRTRSDGNFVSNGKFKLFTGIFIRRQRKNLTAVWRVIRNVQTYFFGQIVKDFCP